MISFEIKPQNESTPDEVEVYFDSIGLSDLIAQLEIISSGKTDHAHLMAESWGGSHLDEETQISSNMPVRHVKLMLVKALKDNYGGR